MVVVPGPSGTQHTKLHSNSAEEPCGEAAEHEGEAPTQAEDQDHMSHTSTAHHGNGSGWQW